MTLKYIYDPVELADYKEAKSLGVKSEVPKIKGVEVVRAGKRQNFSEGFVLKALKEGWLTVGQGRLVLHTIPLLTYTIKRTPGKYPAANHCGYEIIHAYECERVEK